MKAGPSAQGLRRELGLFTAMIIVVANMIGTGIFTTAGFVMQQLQNPVHFQLCWLFGGLFALCGALCYAELGARFPQSGGEYIYIRQSFGPCLGFLSGWISLIVGFSAPIAASAMACVAYLFPGSSTMAPLLACLLILAVSWLHFRSLHLGARVQNGFTLFKLSLLIGFILAAVIWGHGEETALHSRLGTLGSDDVGRWAVALVFVSFAYSGWNAAAYLGGEIRSAQRNLPRALVGGTLIVMLLYLALNQVFLAALSPAEMIDSLDIGRVAATALFSPTIGRWFGIAIAIGLLSVLSAMIMTGPRVYYAMARDGVFFQTVGRLRPLQRTPAAAILLQATIAIVMVLSARFDQLLIYMGFTLSLSAMVTVVGLIWLRHKTPPAKGDYRTPLYPLPPLLFILGNGIIVGFTLYSRPTASWFGLGTLIIGLLVYHVFRYKGARLSKNRTHLPFPHSKEV